MSVIMGASKTIIAQTIETIKNLISPKITESTGINVIALVNVAVNPNTNQIYITQDYNNCLLFNNSNTTFVHRGSHFQAMESISFSKWI